MDWKDIFPSVWKMVWKKKSFRILATLEVILLLIGVIGLMLPAERQEVLSGQENISLKPGIYNVEIHYKATAEGNQLNAYDTLHETGSILFGVVNLYTGDNVEACQMWVLRSTDTAKVEVTYGGSGELEIYELAIVRTNCAARIWIFFVILGSVLINGLFFLRAFDGLYGISREQKVVWGVLAVAGLLSCIPAMVNYNLWGDDWGFHLLRVEGLISGLKDGQFPVRIQGNWLRGYGYAVSVFYSDMFMVIPMVFRLLGFTVRTSCCLFYMVINLSTLLVAYHCLKRVCKDRVIGCVGAVLYTLSAYRMHNLFMRSAVGESLAMVFLPLVFYGFYRIFTEDIYDRKYRGNWLVLTLGLTGIIQSHVLTCEMLALAILILCVVLIKKVFRKETFLVLVKTVVVTLLLNLWYLVPFLDYMLNGKFNVGHPETMTIKEVSDYGLYLTHLLFSFYGQGTQGKIQGIGMGNTGAFSVGVALLIGFLGWLYLEWTDKVKEFKYRGLGRLSFGYTCLFFVLVLDIFPWAQIQHLGGAAQMLTLSLQFPWRFLSLASLSAGVTACVFLLYMKEHHQKEVYGAWAVLLVAVSLFFNAYQSNMQLQSRGFARVYNKQSMGTIYVSNGEYLPYQADISLMQCDLVVPGAGVEVLGYVKGQDTLHMELTVACIKDSESYVELPILYYKGYVAEDVDTGQRLEVEAGDNSVVRVKLPPNYSGTVSVYFGSLWYWRVAECISLLTFCGIVIVVARCRSAKAVVDQGIDSDTDYKEKRRKRREKVAVVEK